MPTRFRTLLLAMVPLWAGCRGAVLDLEFFSAQPLQLRRLELVVDGQPLGFADAGLLALPQTLRVLVDARPVALSTLGVDLEGGVHLHDDVVTLASGETRALRVDLTDVRWCPAPLPPAQDVVLFDEGVHGTVFGYDGSRLSEPVDAARACTGSHLLSYDARGRYDGLGFHTSTARRVTRVEFRARASDTSSWKVGLGEAPDWIPRADAPLFIGTDWRAFSIDVEAGVAATDRVVLQLDSASPVVLELDDVRLTVAD